MCETTCGSAQKERLLNRFFQLPQSVYLICHSDEDRQQENVTIPREFTLHFLLGERQKVPNHAGQEGYRHHEIITVRFNEIMTSDRRWIDMVFTEWTQEILKYSMF